MQAIFKCLYSLKVSALNVLLKPYREKDVTVALLFMLVLSLRS